MTSATPSLLWIDLTVSTEDPSTSADFAETFQLHRVSRLMSVDEAVKTIRPAAACLDFDYPTKQGLKLLQSIKRAHPSLPLIMLTLQHSEALAIWAFRSRVWDYLVKPITRPELDRCLGCLRDVLRERAQNAAPRRAAMPVSTIPEANRIAARRGPLTLSPALTYVERNFSRKVTSANAAALCGLTPFQFSRAFKETYGVSFLEYLLRFRIREACRLLRHPDAQVTDVAYMVGFNDPSHFAKVFRRFTNVSPSRFAELGAAMDPEQLLSVSSSD